MQESDLKDADRIFRLAFGTFLGLPDPLSFAGDSDFVYTRYRTDPDAALVAEVDGKVAGSNFALKALDNPVRVVPLGRLVSCLPYRRHYPV